VKDTCVVRAVAISRAASVIEAAQLHVLGRDWSSGPHRLDLVATPGADILAAVEVRITTSEASPSALVALTEAQFLKATDAARAWMRQRDARYEDLWVVLVTVDPSAAIELVTQNILGVC
jgi:Holliday junction resolvase-like predicted endonuclease